MESILNFLRYRRKYPLDLTHRILDRFASMTICTTVVTHDEVVEFINGLPDDYAIARGPCACRLHTAEALGPDARDLGGGNLDFCLQTPLDVDIQLAMCGEKFGALETYSLITKPELLQLEDECFNMGLVANVYAMMGGDAGICHCSSATCVPLMANEAIAGRSAVIQKGAFVARTHAASCDGTGDCLRVCHFNARKTVRRGERVVSTCAVADCYGCGLCAAVCPRGAIRMERRESVDRVW